MAENNTQNSSGCTWTFLSNHAHVLICLAMNPGIRVRDVAVKVGITERAVQKILRELEECSVLERIREGRRNSYHIEVGAPLRHPLEAHCRVSELLEMVRQNSREKDKPANEKATA